MLLGPARRRTALYELAARKTLGKGMQARPVDFVRIAVQPHGSALAERLVVKFEGGLRTVSAARPRAARWE